MRRSLADFIGIRQASTVERVQHAHRHLLRVHDAQNAHYNVDEVTRCTERSGLWPFIACHEELLWHGRFELTQAPVNFNLHLSTYKVLILMSMSVEINARIFSIVLYTKLFKLYFSHHADSAKPFSRPKDNERFIELLS